MGQQTAINTFSEGLNFDLNPITTPNNILTDAINSTFITFNGDELALQNDAGNTKIEYQEQVITSVIKYGALYNWYAATDSRYIAASGWHVSSNLEIEILSTYLSINKGGKLKEILTTFWNSPNTGATNELGFNARGSGARNNFGGFQYLKVAFYLWTTSDYDGSNANSWIILNNDDNLYNIPFNYKHGFSIRLIKDTTTLTHGQSGTYIGNDGKNYSTICINGVEYLSENLAETKYRNGDYIHGYELGIYTPITGANWTALTTEGMCFYEDLEENGETITITTLDKSVQLSEGFYPLGIKEYGGVLYIISGKLPDDPKTNVNITSWIQGTSYLQDKIVYKDSPIERLYYKAKKNTSANLPIETSQDWEIIGNEKDYNNMFGEVEFGSYPSPEASGSVLYEGSIINFTGTPIIPIYRWIPTGLNSYCIVDINGKNTGERMTEEKYQISNDGGIIWTDVPETPVRNITVINTTECPLPIAWVGMVLDTTIYDINNEYPVAYVPGQGGIGVDTPIKSGYNYLFFSVPSNKTLTIKNSLGIDITNSFSIFGVDDRPEHQTNTIYRKNDMFASEISTHFNLTIV